MEITHLKSMCYRHVWKCCSYLLNQPFLELVASRGEYVIAAPVVVVWNIPKGGGVGGGGWGRERGGEGLHSNSSTTI